MVSFLFNNMRSRFKLVASALVTVVLAMPVSALAPCWLHMTPAEHCTPHCAMMSGHASSVTIQEAPSDSSCCRVSAARPTPASVPKAPSDSGSRLAPTFVAAALDIPTVPTRTEPFDPLARASCPSLQSVFCTFLI